jgi:hypothetical protein
MLRILPLLLSVLGFAFLSGCATPPKVSLPYVWPDRSAPSLTSASHAAEIVKVTDSREDRSLDKFLEENPTDSLRKALAAELVASGAFLRIATSPEANPIPTTIEADLHEMSWSVPNYKSMVQTAFVASFLTGGLGGLAYGSTETPVVGHAVVALKIIEQPTGRVILDRTFEGTEEEHMAKLKCDTLQTRAHVMAAALKKALVSASQAVESIENPVQSSSARQLSYSAR